MKDIGLGSTQRVLCIPAVFQAFLGIWHLCFRNQCAVNIEDGFDSSQIISFLLIYMQYTLHASILTISSYSSYDPVYLSSIKAIDRTSDLDTALPTQYLPVDLPL